MTGILKIIRNKKYTQKNMEVKKLLKKLLELEK